MATRHGALLGEVGDYPTWSWPIAMALSPISASRHVVEFSMRSQARVVGLWQHHDQLIWWQSGLPSFGANVVLNCGLQPDLLACGRLAKLMAWGSCPVGWMVWPDQQPQRQKSVLIGAGFQHQQTIALLSRPSADLSQSSSGALICALDPGHQRGFAEFLKVCHQLPPGLAGVVSQAFLQRKSCGQGDQQFCTFAVMEAGAPIASITACVLPGFADTIGGLLWLGTHPSFRRQGLARDLTARACGWLAQQGAVRVFVQAAAQAEPLYRQLAFQQDGVLELWTFEPIR
jgi:GNAT superfamily N-acetyltransferase